MPSPPSPTPRLRRGGWRLVAAGAAVLMVLTACGSGPSDAALERNSPPSTTTTTEPIPEGVFIVRIVDTAFRPANVEIDLTTEWIVEWRNEDADMEYVIVARNGEFESPPISGGSSWQVDFSELEPALYRYSTTVGRNRVPGIIDTRPAQ